MKSHHFYPQVKAIVLIICTTFTGFSQSIKAPIPKEEPAQANFSFERNSLINELQILERETLKFNDPFIEAMTKVEVADAAWQLDRSWAKKLLRRSFELVLPKAEQKQDRPVGSIPPMPNSANRSLQKVRHRVLTIARQDKEFSNELIQLEAERLGAYEKHFTLAVLADQALMGGDVKESANYIVRGIEADPTHGTAPYLINAIALRDRALADSLVLHYINEVRKFPIGSANQSDIRTFFILRSLIKPSLFDPTENPEPIKVPPPGAEVMKIYVSYMLEALSGLEKQEPGYLQRRRLTLLSIWIPLQQYAPDLVNEFLVLDGRSRRPGDNSPLPTPASEEKRRAQFKQRMKEQMGGDQPHEGLIYMAIGQGDFDKARKMIDKLSDEAKKRQFNDMVDAEEAVRIAPKGRMYEAENLARKLVYASSILRVYPVLIKKCADDKDQHCVTRLVHQALKQVKTSDTSTPVPPEGIPISAVAADQRFDVRLPIIGKLSVAVLPFGDESAFYLLEEFVAASNANQEAEQARISYDVSAFKKLAPRNTARAQQAAYALRNSVQRVLALAAIFQWQAKELIERQSKSVKTN